MSTEEILSLASEKNDQRNALMGMLEAYCADLTWQHAAELFREAFPTRYTEAS